MEPSPQQPGQPSSYAPATYNVSAPAASPRPGFWTVLRRFVRLFVRRLLYGLVVVLRPLRPFAAFVVIILGLLGVLGWMAAQIWFPASAGPRDTRVALLPPSSAVENYIKGQQNYNAELMWAALSPESQASQLQGGASKQTMQSRVDQKKQSGLHFNRYQYIGGVELEDGGSMFFYSVDVEMQSQHAKLPMTFVVDSDGKVSDIFSSSLLTDLSQTSNS